MTQETNNLRLLMYDPATDGNQYFDFDTGLNDNWQKIDDKLGAQASSPAPTALNLGYGAQVIDMPRIAPYNVMSMKGRTLVNLLGRIGNFETSPMVGYTTIATSIAANSDMKAYGKQGLRITATTTSNMEHYADYTNYNCVLPDPNGAYLMAFESVRHNNVYPMLRIYGTGLDVSVNTLASGATTEFELSYQTFIANNTPEVAMRLQLKDGQGNSVYVQTGEAATFDGVRLYHITPEERTYINSLSQSAGRKYVTANYPYVDDMKPIMNPYVVAHGENLLPPFTEWISFDTSISTITSPYAYSMTVGSATQKQNLTELTPVPGKAYTLSVDISANARLGVDFLNDNGDTIQSSGFVSTNPLTVTAPSGASAMRVFLANDGTAGTFTFTNPMLNLGDTAQPFVPRHDQVIVFPTQLRSSQNGTITDSLYRRSSEYWVDRQIAYTEFTGDLPWIHSAIPIAGAKRIEYANGLGADPNNQTAIKYDGKILTQNNSANLPDTFLIAAGAMYLVIPNADSGWGESYSPTPGECKACMYGWRMYQWEGGIDTPYSGTGTKAWFQILNIGIGTQSLPTSTYSNWIPYRGQYKRTTPIPEQITPEGELTLRQGLNQLEVGNGMIVRERANTTLSGVTSGWAYINDNILPSSALKYRALKILTVHRNSLSDKSWTIDNMGKAEGYLGQRAYKPIVELDQSAAYTVTYLALDQYSLTCNVQSIEGDYAANMKTQVDELAQDYADLATRVSVVETQKTNKVQPQWISPTLLNGGVDYGLNYPPVGYRINQQGVLEFRGLIRDVAIADNTILFYLPPEYTPKYTRTQISVMSGGASPQETGCRITINPADGSVSLRNTFGGVPGWVSIDNLQYLLD